jgi:hypothetical protein
VNFLKDEPINTHNKIPKNRTVAGKKFDFSPSQVPAAQFQPCNSSV